MNVQDLEIRIEYDQYAENPREMFDNLGKIVYHSNRYMLGDEDISPDEFEMPKDAIYLPVYANIHGSISLSVSEYAGSWDSGMSGYIYTTPDKIREFYGDNIPSESDIKEALKGEIAEFSAYLSGEVYGYRILDRRTGEELDSCWGFYGYDYCREYAEGEAQGIVDSANQREYDSAVREYLYAREKYQAIAKEIA
ncbi:MAG: hypothetical protein HDQ88_09345 [Clostridia bacterium]|nr:hypothetical protein [Clostridia bacterium]